MKMIMYHYIREFCPKSPFFKFLSFDDFRLQLDHFAKNTGFIEKKDFLAVLQGKMDPLPPGVVLTFDDGLIDHYEYVLPELRARGLWGLFFIPGFPHAESDFLDVHKIHLILGKADAASIRAMMNEIIAPEMLTDQGRTDYQNNPYALQKEDAGTLIKRILNYYIDYRFRAEVVGLLFERFCKDAGPCSAFYLSLEQARTMQDQGMMIGSHGYAHKVFSKMDPAQQKEDILKADAVLKPVLKSEAVKTFCYPYGGDHSFNEATVQILQDAGYNFAVSVDPRDVTPSDLRSRPYALPRFDCNQFPHGTIYCG